MSKTLQNYQHKDTQCLCNAILRCVPASIVVVEKAISITYSVCVCVCVCICVGSPSYPASNAHAPYCHLWPIRLYYIFSHYLKRHDFFGEKKLSNITYVLIFQQLLFETFFHSKKNSARYCYKCTLVFV